MEKMYKQIKNQNKQIAQLQSVVEAQGKELKGKEILAEQN
jgi:hypothetical protein